MMNPLAILGPIFICMVVGAVTAWGLAPLGIPDWLGWAFGFIVMAALLVRDWWQDRDLR